MKKSISHSTVIMNVFCILLFSIFIASCAPSAPKPPRLYSASELEHHPKDANGNPEGYKVLYSRTGINSVDYVKASDLEKYEAKNTVAGADNLVLMPYKKGETLQFHITAAWAKEEQNPFKNSTDFFAYLKEWSENLNELIIK